MNLQFIKYYLALAETKNFSRAAEKMNVVQSTFSAGIKKLESQLDTQLFYRDKRNVRMTAEGERLKPLARDLLAKWNSIEVSFNHLEDKVLSVGLLKNVLVEAVIPRFSRFREQFPVYSIEVLEGDQDSLARKLAAKELDCVIAKEGSLEMEGYESQHLYTEELRLAVSVDHELANKGSVPLRQLESLPVITRAACSLYDEVFSELESRGIGFKAAFSSENDEVVKGLVSAGIGVAMMSEPEKEEEGIRYIPLSDASFQSNIVMFWEGSNRKSVLEAFRRV